MGLFTGIALALTAASTVTSVVAQRKAKKAEEKQGEIQKKAADAQAWVLDYNAAVADVQAKDAVDRGAEAEQRFRSQVRGTVGAQRAAIAGNNVDVSFGSAVDVQADAAMLGELDALTIRTNAAREAWGYKVQATDIRNRAAVTRKEGVMMQEAAKVGASAYNWQTATTLLGGGASLLQMRYGFNQSGGGGGGGAWSSASQQRLAASTLSTVPKPSSRLGSASFFPGLGG